MPRRSIVFQHSSVSPRFFLRTVEYVALLIRQCHSCAVVGSFVGFPVRSIVDFKSAVSYTSYFILGRIRFRFFLFRGRSGFRFHSSGSSHNPARIRAYSYLPRISVALDVSLLPTINRSAPFLLFITVSHSLR